jgi:hypothetical protein
MLSPSPQFQSLLSLNPRQQSLLALNLQLLSLLALNLRPRSQQSPVLKETLHSLQHHKHVAASARSAGLCT